MSNKVDRTARKIRPAPVITRPWYGYDVRPTWTCLDCGRIPGRAVLPEEEGGEGGGGAKMMLLLEVLFAAWAGVAVIVVVLLVRMKKKMKVKVEP